MASDVMSAIQDLAPAVQLGWTGRAYVLVLLVGVPFLALLQPDDRDLLLPPRIPLYWTAVVSVWVLAGLTGLVLWLEAAGPRDIGLVGAAPATFAAWTAMATAGALLGSLLISRAAAGLGLKESRLTYHLMPRSPRERRTFIVVSASAGICEEFTYHGFLLAALVGWLGNGWVAALVANLAFGILHGYQGQAGVLRAFLMGYVLCLPVVVGAGLGPAMTAHFAVNVLLGMGLWRWMMPPEGRDAAEGLGDGEGP